MGPGFRGKGWVGHEASPGTGLFGTGRSSMPNIGSPVRRLKMKSSDIFVTTATAGIFLPFFFTSMRVGAAGRSKSHRS